MAWKCIQENSLFKFWLPVQFGLESLAFSECTDKLQLLNITEYTLTKEEAGLTLFCSLETACLLNHYLKIPNRILWRISEFKAKDTFKLYNKLVQIQWNHFLNSAKFNAKVSTKKSKLINAKIIESSLESAIMDHCAKQAPKKDDNPFIHNIYIRLYDDLVNVSIDLSGEHLHKRNNKLVDKAPLRENYAAALFQFAMENNINTLDTVFDPMAGSATIALEASNYFKAVTNRKFNYQFLRKYPIHFKKLVDLKNNSIKNILINDINPSCTEAAKSTLKSISEEVKIQYHTGNLFDFNLNKLSPETLIITNAPYGHRIAVSKNFFQRLMEYISNSPIQNAIILLPNEECLKIKKYIKKRLDFNNNGISVSAIYYEKSGNHRP